MPNILITSAGGAGIADLSRALMSDHHLFFADAKKTLGDIYQKIPYFQIPLATDPGYKGALKDIIDSNKIDYLVPGHDHELIPCADLREAAGIRCILPSKEFVVLCLNKKGLMQQLHEEGISHLSPFMSMEEVVYPAFAKPVSGSGSRGAHRIDSEEQLDGYCNLYQVSFSDVLVQPYADGQEYTVSVIVNNNNQLIGIVPKCVHEKRGLTLHATSERNEIIEKACISIVDKLDPCGPFNVQMVLKENECFIFEINPRLSSTAILTEAAFGSEIDLYIRYFDAEVVENMPTMKEGVEFKRRYVQEIY